MQIEKLSSPHFLITVAQFKYIPECFQFILFRSFPKEFHFPLSVYPDKHRQNALRPIYMMLSWKYEMAVKPTSKQTHINAQYRIYLYSKLIKQIDVDDQEEQN